MSPPSAATSRPPQPPAPAPRTALSPEEEARVTYYRAQFRAMGMTDAEIDDPLAPGDPADVAAHEA